MSFLNLDYHIDQTTQPVTTTINRILPRIPMAIIALLIGILIIKLLSWLIKFSLSLTKLPKGLREVIGSLIDVALWIFLSIALLQVVGLNNVALAVTGSFAFVVLGLSQGGATAIADVIAGVTLSKDRDFNVGDYIKIGDKSAEGIVEEIDLRRTRLRDREGRMHIMSNAAIDRSGWILIERSRDFSSSARRLRISRKRKVTKPS